MQLWRYVITTDEGKAPNYDPPSVTLAICKSGIRKGADVGDLVLAFAGARLRRPPHSVVWAGRVAQKLLFSSYWNAPDFQSKKPRFSDRPDNIYEPVSPGRYRRVENTSHGPECEAGDLKGEYVLVFDQFWRIETNDELPDEWGLQMSIGSRRGHRRGDLTDERHRALIRWLTERASSTSAQPPKPPHDNGGCTPPKAKPRPPAPC
ncbi:hypothetical protein [Azorhizobium doebereinerae]|uniref:Nmad2 family putative nucleotide modification protein n=1 Tax=Azorhizobium doebereinerae TaxID=281091 RepID=UPI0018DEB671